MKAATWYKRRYSDKAPSAHDVGNEHPVSDYARVHSLLRRHSTVPYPQNHTGKAKSASAASSTAANTTVHSRSSSRTSGTNNGGTALMSMLVNEEEDLVMIDNKSAVVDKMPPPPPHRSESAGPRILSNSTGTGTTASGNTSNSSSRNSVSRSVVTGPAHARSGGKSAAVVASLTLLSHMQSKDLVNCAMKVINLYLCVCMFICPWAMCRVGAVVHCWNAITSVYAYGCVRYRCSLCLSILIESMMLTILQADGQTAMRRLCSGRNLRATLYDM